MLRRPFAYARPFAIATAVLLLTGCATIERQETKSTEQLLAAAGFDIRPADTPDKLASLQSMKQHKLIRRQGTDGRLQFTWADAAVCRCIYVGDEAAFQRYQRLSIEKQVAVAQQEAALDEQLDSPWAYGWWSVPY